MDQTEFDFNAIGAEQYVTPLDRIMDHLRSKAISVNKQPQTSEGLVSGSASLVHIADVQTAVQQAYRLGRDEGYSAKTKETDDTKS